MKKLFILSAVLLSFITVFSQQNDAEPAAAQKFLLKKISSRNSMENPLLKQWNTPFQTPPFAEIQDTDYLPAFQMAISQAKAEVRKIAYNQEPPTFENTIVALETSGELLNRVSGVFYNLLECNATPELQKLAQEISPKLTAFSNYVNLNPDLFARVKAVYENPGDLTPEQKMLLDNTYRSFVKNGANLSEEDKEKYRTISMNLSTLSLKFSENALASTNAYVKNITDKNLLSGIPEGQLAIAKEKAQKKGMQGWCFDLSQPSVSAVLTYADNRELRKEIYMHYNTVAYKGDYDNQQVIKDILKNRYEMALLLGYKNYAEYALQDRMAENAENVYKLEDQLLEYSLPAMKKEMEELTKYAKSIGFNDEIQRWDFAYYSNKHKMSLYSVSDEMLKPYFKLENVIDGVFGLAKNLFDLEFVPNKEIQVYHPDVKVYEVYRHGKFMSVLYLDFHPRDTKRGGAWMTSFRSQSNVNGKEVRPLVSLVMNFTPSTAETPSLLTFYEVETFLHEFGHATHDMLSDVTYESLSGTNVPRDFVELPSQLLENWGTEKEFLDKFAFHYQTGETIPLDLIRKIKDANNYHAGYASCRQISFGLLDMMWHTTNPQEIDDILKYERSSFDKTEIMPVVPGTCMSTNFSHIFAGGYAAGYYGYKWAEVLDADAFSLFKEKGVFNKSIADHYVKSILSKGGSEKSGELYRNFRGREPKIDALLERSGLK